LITGPKGKAHGKCLLTDKGKKAVDEIVSRAKQKYAKQSWGCNSAEFQIDITVDHLRKYRPYNQAEIDLDMIDKKVEELLARGIIRKSKSPCSFPVVLAVKPESKEKRFCINYMELNKVTINDAFPISTIESILARLKGATIFAKLDMEAGYWQIRMKETDKWKTAFATRKGLFEWNFMGFGLKNASACFQREMTHALVDIEGVFPYIDDLMVYAENEDQLIDRIRVVMERLIEINIRPNWAKCEFGMNQIMYCGHLVSPSGIRADVGRFDPIENLANPSTPKEFKSMIGFFNFFRKFIPKFAKWDDDCQKSKEKIVELIKRDITLAYPDRNKSFVIRCDASDVAASFILLQNHEGIERPIYFGSKGFSKEQIGRYAAGQKELFSIVLALRIFRPWILGRKVIIYSDCKSWSWLSSITKPSGLLLRWIYDLLE